MSNIVKVISETDDSLVEFIFEDPKSGAVKDVYFHPQKQYVVAFYQDDLKHSGIERLEKLVGQYRKDMFNKEGGEYFKNLSRWPEKIVRYNGKIGMVLPFYDTQFFFPDDCDNLAGEEKKGGWYTSGKNFNRFVPDSQKGSLLGFLKVCLYLSRAVKRLHALGLAHSDLSTNNCLIDPLSGSTCIIDIDGLVVPGLFSPDVYGTPGFMAPEIVKSQHLPKDDPKCFLPSIKTDEHSLAVLIYNYLFHRHPLKGSKVWDIDDDERHETLLLGEKALFVENPTDDSNRIRIGSDDKDYLPWDDTNILPYTISGPYLKPLFDNAFIYGLHDPALRPIAADWDYAFVKTLDQILPCSNPNCVKQYFIFSRNNHPICPYCGTKYTLSIPVLQFYFTRDGKKFNKKDHSLIVFNNQYIYKWHVDNNFYPNELLKETDKKPVGIFQFIDNQWIFRNINLPYLKNISDKSASIDIGNFIILKNGLQLLFSNSLTSHMGVVQILNF
jgi:serine/threonine protein kinase